MTKLLNKKPTLSLIIILFIVIKTSIEVFALAERTDLINLQGNFKENEYVNHDVQVLASGKGNLYEWSGNTRLFNMRDENDLPVGNLT